MRTAGVTEQELSENGGTEKYGIHEADRFRDVVRRWIWLDWKT